MNRYPINAPEYANQKNRLSGIIRGKPFIPHHEEVDSANKKGTTYHPSKGNPQVEVNLIQELHFLSVINKRTM